MSRRASSTLLPAALALAALALPAAARAQASGDELLLSAGPMYAAVPDFAGDRRGLGGALALSWGFSDAVSLGAHLSWSHHFGIDRLGEHDDLPASNLAAAFLGVGYNVDVLAVIPYVSLMPGIYIDDGALGEERIRIGLKAALGLDYRPLRNWAVGAQIDWHAVLPQPLDYPAYSTVWFRTSYFFELDRL